jgi:predicted MPP superfamily phosphohydrolase
VTVPLNLGLRVGILADIHADPVLMPPALVRQAVDALNASGPLDAVLVPGDFAAHTAESVPAAVAELTRLQAPVFASLGNHDGGRRRQPIVDALDAHGISLLDNRATPFPGRTDVWLVGLASMLSGKPDVDAAFAAVPDGARAIVLGHEPGLARLHSATLHVAGHTHHGQIRMPGIRPPYLPKASMPWIAGLYSIPSSDDQRWIYTTAGIGSATISLRIGAPPEVVVLTL